MSNKMNLVRARRLRRNPTDAERKLWYWLRLRQCKGFKFRRQFPVGQYIVDFICLDAKLIIEADGGDHNTALNILYDKNRTTELEKHGYRVIRFWNDEILTQIEVVLESIVQALENQLVQFAKEPSCKGSTPHPVLPLTRKLVKGRNLLQT